MAKILVPCPHCHGSGNAALPQKLLETLAKIDRRPRTSREVLKATGEEGAVTLMAMNGRLKRLRGLGFIKSIGRSKQGCELQWVRVSQ
jgi:hypothetical protein